MYCTNTHAEYVKRTKKEQGLAQQSRILEMFQIYQMQMIQLAIANGKNSKLIQCYDRPSQGAY